LDNQPVKPTKDKNELKNNLRQLFNEIMDDWLMQVHYLIEVNAMNPAEAEQKVLQRYRNWIHHLESLLKNL